MTEHADATTKVKKDNWFKRHPLWSIALAIVTIGVIAGMSSGTTTKNSATPASAPTTRAAAVEKIGLNQSARDGKFEFTVSGVECGKDTIGPDSYNQVTAQGQFCLLSVSVKNIGNEPQSLFSSNQKVYNASGQKYAADDTATIYASSGASSWYSDINPGNSVSGQIVFDMPKDQTPVTAELHDSAYSNGVTVQLN